MRVGEDSWQAEARKQAENGDVVTLVFDRAKNVEIPSSFVAAALTGNAFGPGAHDLRKLEIEGATLIGKIALADGRAKTGSGLGALILRNCWITDHIDLENAHLRRLVLRDCSILALRGRNLRVDGDVDLSGLSSFEDTPAWRGTKTGCNASAEWYLHGLSISEAKVRETPTGLCWVDLRHALIGGSLAAERARFVAPEARSREEHTRGFAPNRYALDLGAARIGAGAVLEPGFQAMGGINLSNANITGDVWMDGAILDCVEGHGFRAQSAEISGVLSLRAGIAAHGTEERIPFVCRGGAWLVSARVGALYLTGGKFISRKHLKTDADGDDGLALALTRGMVTDDISAGSMQANAKVGDNTPIRTEFRGEANFGLAEVLGDFRFHGVDCEERLVLPQTVGRSVFIQDLLCKDGVLGANVRVARDLVVELSTKQRENSVEIDLTDATIEGAARVSRMGVRRLQLDRLECGHDLLLQGRGNLAFRDGEVLARNVSVGYNCLIEGNIDAGFDFSNLTCGGSLELGGVTFLTPDSESDNERHYDEYGLKTTADGGHIYLDLTNATVAKALKLARHVRVAPQQDDARPLAMRRTGNLSFYPQWRAVEVLIQTRRGRALRSLLELAESTTETSKVQLSSHALPPTILLDGASPPIHELNGKGALKLTADNALDYLKFFCANVWGDEGAFNVVDKQDLEDGNNFRRREVLAGFTDEQVKQVKEPLLKGEDEEGYLVEATIQYAQGLFQANFRVRKDGMIEMLNDEPIGRERKPGSAEIVYDRPYRRAEGERHHGRDRFPLSPAYFPGSKWETEKPAELEKLALKAPSLGGQNTLDSKSSSGKQAPIYVKLAGMKVKTLDDDGGERWIPELPTPDGGYSCCKYPTAQTRPAKLSHKDPIRLDLRGLEYAEDSPAQLQSRPVALGSAQPLALSGGRNSAPLGGRGGIASAFREAREAQGTRQEWHPDLWRTRRLWLARQFRGRNGNHHPQPFEELERAYMRRGDFRNADGIRAHRARIGIDDAAKNAAKAWWSLPAALVVHIGGCLAWLTSRYALDVPRAIITCVALWLVGWLGVAWANNVGYLALDVQPVHEINVAGVQADRRFEASVPCGDEIVPALYALDVLVPLLDLQQETRCEVSDDAWRPQLDIDLGVWQSGPLQFNVWEIARGLYMILGWIMLSLTIFTFTRSMQRRSRQV